MCDLIVHMLKTVYHISSMKIQDIASVLLVLHFMACTSAKPADKLLPAYEDFALHPAHVCLALPNPLLPQPPGPHQREHQHTPAHAALAKRNPALLHLVELAEQQSGRIPSSTQLVIFRQALKRYEAIHVTSTSDRFWLFAFDAWTLISHYTCLMWVIFNIPHWVPRPVWLMIYCLLILLRFTPPSTQAASLVEIEIRTNTTPTANPIDPKCLTLWIYNNSKLPKWKHAYI